MFIIGLQLWCVCIVNQLSILYSFLLQGLLFDCGTLFFVCSVRVVIAANTNNPVLLFTY